MAPPIRNHHPTLGNIAINTWELCHNLTRSTQFTETDLRNTLLSLGCTIHTHSVLYLSRKCLGKAYRSKNTVRYNPKSFDCSSLVAYIYAQLGVCLPRYTKWQADVGQDVTQEERMPGDLIFTPHTRGWSGIGQPTIGHVAIATEGGQCIHTDNLNTKRVVEIKETALFGKPIIIRRILPHPDMVTVVRLSDRLVKSRIFSVADLEPVLRQVLQSQS